MSSTTKLRAYLYASVAAGAISLPATSAFAVCAGPGAPTTTQTKCVTAILIPDATDPTKILSLQSFDISWSNPNRAEYYLGDRSNKGIDIIDTNTLSFKRTITGFVGVVFNSTFSKIDNAHSGPDGVTSHGHWLYGGDGNSTLKVIDLNDPSPGSGPIKASISTGGTTRLDEMALTTDGTLLVAANNAEDPPFGTLFHANGDSPSNTMTPASIITKIQLTTFVPPSGPLDPSTFPATAVIIQGAGQSIEQPTWDPTTKRFYVSIPYVANNPVGCDPSTNGTPGAPHQCDGGLLVINPATVTPGTTTYGFYDSTTNTGVIKLHDCGPNGASVGPHDNIILGCTPGNNTNNTTTQVINATTHNFVEVGNVTGSDEVWFNSGDRRYYLGASKNPTHGSDVTLGSVLGVVNAGTNFLIEKIAASNGSHSVAADAKRNLIFLPEVCTTAPSGDPVGHPTAVNIGCDGNHDTATGNTVSQEVCGSPKGCVAVYKHDVDEDQEEANHQGDDDHG